MNSFLLHQKRFCLQNRMMFGVLMMVLSACQSPPNVQDSSLALPQWVMEPALLYPEDQYLSAVGSGGSPAVANRVAQGNLAQIFQVQIRQSLLIQQQDHLSEYQKFISRATNVSSDVSISGVQIVQSWHDAQNDIYYALAVLARAPALSALVIEIENIMAEMDALIANLPSTQTPRARWKALQTWYRVDRRYPSLNDLVQRCQVIAGAPCPTSPPTYSAIEIAHHLSTAIAALPLQQIVSAEENADTLRLQAQQALDAIALPHREQPDALRFAVHLTSPESRQINGWWRLRAAIQIRVTTAEGTLLNAVHLPLRVASIRKDVAFERLAQQTHQVIQHQLLDRLLIENTKD